MYDAVCLASGGLDSVVCLHLLRQQGIKALPVFVNYGQRNLKKEFGSLVANLKSAKFPMPVVINVSGFGKVIKTGLTDPRKRVLEDAFTPNRNLLFLLLAASVAFSRGISFIVLGFLSEKTAIFPDQSDRFLSVARDAIKESLGAELRSFVRCARWQKVMLFAYRRRWELSAPIRATAELQSHAVSASPVLSMAREVDNGWFKWRRPVAD